MNIRRKSTGMLLLLALALPSAGQAPALLRDFDFVRRSNPLLEWENAAAYRHLQTEKISRVGGFAAKENGGLIDISHSDDAISGGIFTESYMRASDRTVLYGRMSWDGFRGRNMGADILLDPASPIHFLETEEAPRGIKTLERYRLEGGVSYRVSPSWTLGAKADYTTADRAKRRDPRTSNTLMDLDLSIGAERSVASGTFGFNLSWRQAIDQVEAGLYGVNESLHSVFIDYGGLYGKRELFLGDEGYISLSNPRPLVSRYYGGALQYASGRSTRLALQLRYRYLDGHFGQKGSTRVTFCEYGGHLAGLSAVLLKEGNGGGRLHRIALEGDFRLLSNDENIYRITTVPGQNSVVTYFGQNRVLDQKNASALLSYVLYDRIEEFRPRNEYGASLLGEWLDATTTLYPWYRERSLLRYRAELYGRRGIPAAGGLLSFGASLHFSAGSGDSARDGSLAQSISDSPRSLDGFVAMRHEYLTAPQAGAALRLGYLRPLGARFALEISLEDGFSALLSAPGHLPGRTHNTARLQVGLTF